MSGQGLGSLGGAGAARLPPTFGADWAALSPGSGGGGGGAVDALLLGGMGGLPGRPGVALQEGSLRLGEGASTGGGAAAAGWREELLALQQQQVAATARRSPGGLGKAGGEPSWVTEMLSKADAELPAPSAGGQFGPSPRYGTPSGGALLPLPPGSAPQQATPYPALQPRAPSSAQAPFSSLTPYLQPQHQPQQLVPQQQPHLAQGPAQPLPSRGGLGAAPPAGGQRQGEQRWKGLFSEVFEASPRGDSPFGIPDLADIEGARCAGLGRALGAARPLAPLS